MIDFQEKIDDIIYLLECSTFSDDYNDVIKSLNRARNLLDNLIESID